MGLVIVIAIIVIAVIYFLTRFRIVPQSEQWVIEQMGTFKDIWQAGFHVLTPFVGNIAKKISTKELSLDVPPQPVITKDNVTILIDSFAFYRIVDARLYAYGIDNFPQAMATLTISNLRAIVGNLDLEGCLTKRDEINSRITAQLDEATDKWGVKVVRVEIKNITPPRDIQQAMDRQMKAEREKREKLISAEGERGARLQQAQSEKETQILRAEADKESALMSAEAAKLKTIKAAEADKEARLLEAEASKVSALKNAEAQAEAIRMVGQAQAEAIRLLNAAAPSEAVLKLKAYEALSTASQGSANKLIIPSDVASAVSLASSIKEGLR